MTGYAISDTIVAPAAAPVAQALACVRLSGSGTQRVLRALAPGLPEALTPRHAYLATLLLAPAGPDAAAKSQLTTRAVVTFWQAPMSYTSEDLAEISLHGSPALVRACLAAACAHGARPAEAGEFTYRAYLNGKLDLAQAEAVHELITAGSQRAALLAEAGLSGLPARQARAWVARLTDLLAAIEVIHDYAADASQLSPGAGLLTQEQLVQRVSHLRQELSAAQRIAARNQALREGLLVAVCGPPNAGKSTLFNALLGYDRALTSATPGTTRDYLAESLETEGVRLTLIDTAGYRTAADALEAAGVTRAGEWAHAAHRMLWVTTADEAEVALPAQLAGLDCLHVVNKCDLLPAWPARTTEPAGPLYVSALTQKGLDLVLQRLSMVAQAGELDPANVFNLRQARLLDDAGAALDTALSALGQGVPWDAVAQDLHNARGALHGVYEQPDRQAVIDAVFRNFCVGK